MQISFDDSDIRQQVLDFLNSMAIYPYDERDIILDGELHRFRTKDDKAGQTSGAIRIYTDGCPAGFVQDWRRGIKEDWKYDTSKFSQEQLAYFNSEEFKEKAKEQHRKAEEERRIKKLIVSDKARQVWNLLMPATNNHPYLVRKHVKSYGLRMDGVTHELAVPLVNISGQIISIQWIPPEPKSNKLFYKGASLEGAFYSAGLETLTSNPESEILLGEGYATIAKVHELTSKPCVAAMSCYRLKETAQILRKAYPDAKIIVIADNDWETEKEREFNPGIREAKFIVNAGLAIDYAAPEFTENDTGLSDWDDYALKYGDDKAKEILQQKIQWAVMTPAEREEYTKRTRLLAVIHNLNPNTQLPPQEFVGGIFPRKFVSLLIAPPGTGKTIFVQKFVSDISIGGSVFDGVADDEPERKSLILAGEAGYELLLRRGASMKWPVKPENVKVLDEYEAENKDINVMLDSEEGMENIERLVDMFNPDILFIDTFSSFHESDENKAPEMKPILKRLAALARGKNMAVVPVHHSRKRAAKERSLSLNQDDVIGSSIMNRLVGLIIGIEPMKDNESVLLVRALKSWFSTFMPFTYTLKENLYGGTTVQTDLMPAGVTNTKSSVWFYLVATFKPNEWFSASQIILSEVSGNITGTQLRRSLAELVKMGRLNRRGAKKYLEYSIPD